MFKINYDALGIAASVACAIHCALLPLVLTSLPILGVNIINNIWFELMMILIALFIGIYSLRHGFKKHHHSFQPLIIFLIGFIFLIAKQFSAYEFVLLAIAVLLIIIAHVNNYRLCAKNKCNSPHHKH